MEFFGKKFLEKNSQHKKWPSAINEFRSTLFFISFFTSSIFMSREFCPHSSNLCFAREHINLRHSNHPNNKKLTLHFQKAYIKRVVSSLWTELSLSPTFRYVKIFDVDDVTNLSKAFWHPRHSKFEAGVTHALYNLVKKRKGGRSGSQVHTRFIYFADFSMHDRYDSNTNSFYGIKSGKRPKYDAPTRWWRNWPEGRIIEDVSCLEGEQTLKGSKKI